jgi:hypothetical protein
MMDFWNENPVLRGAVYALGAVAVVGFFVWLSRPSAPHAASDPAAAAATATPATAAPGDRRAPSRTSEQTILAECHPDLSPNTASVPRFDVSRFPRPSTVSLKVRFWVNGDGFVSKAFYAGGSINDPQDLEEALHYVKGLIFQVPDKDQCRTREIEILGEFRESADAAGEWATVLEIHPRYASVEGRVLEYR